MTGSRCGLLTTSLAVVMVLALQSASGRRRGGQLVLLLLFIPVFALTIQTVATTNKSTIERFGTLQRPMEVDSLRTRLDEFWKDAGNDFAQSPFVGHGPAKKSFTDIITDSEYLDVLKEFGIIGFCVYLAYYPFPLHSLWKGLRSAKRAGPWLEDRLPAHTMAVRLSFIMIVTAMVMSIGETTFYSQVLRGFLWIWMGIGARSAKTIGDSAEILHAKQAHRSAPFATSRGGYSSARAAQETVAEEQSSRHQRSSRAAISGEKPNAKCRGITKVCGDVI